MKVRLLINIAVVITLLTFPVGIKAQNAAQVLDKMIKVIQENAVQTNFGLVVKEPNLNNTSTLGGTFIMHGRKFTFKTTEMLVVFDGETQWAYMKDINEVSITNPTNDELSLTNPLILLHTYRDKSALRLVNNSLVKNAYAIELTPKNINSDIKKINVVVQKSTYYPQSIEMIDKKGVKTTLTLTKFQTGAKITNTTFKFDASVYKGIEINDLR